MGSLASERWGGRPRPHVSRHTTPWSRSWPLLLLFAVGALFAQSPKYGLGRTPSPEEIHRWDISISPDGTGLPEGSGTAAAGKEIYANRCAKCHGAKGEGRDSVPVAGGQGTLKNPKPLRTVGSYWPYATTIWDYVNRAMPFNNPGMLTHDQVYSVTAYILFLNGIVSETAVIDARTLPKVRMPNRDGFVSDSRPDVIAPRKR
jgi:mono/diheme cytochrome c family protein